MSSIFTKISIIFDMTNSPFPVRLKPRRNYMQAKAMPNSLMHNVFAFFTTVFSNIVTSISVYIFKYTSSRSSTLIAPYHPEFLSQHDNIF